MISFNLKCANNHEFEGWFKDSDNFNSQNVANHVECPSCGSHEIIKTLSAPNISTSRRQENAQAELIAKTHQVIEKMRETVETNCDNVGENFAEEARKIHYGESEERGIYGKATESESKELVDEGIEFLPLPWMEKDTKN